MAEALPMVPATRVDPDLTLIRQMAAGDTDALGQFYARHGAGVLAYIVGRLGDRRLAEEVLQDVMLAAWAAAPDFRGDSKVRTWLLTIAHHRAVNAGRRRGPPRARMQDALAAVPELPGHEPGAEAELADLRGALARLPPEQRAALELVFAHGLTTAEAAAVLGVAPGTVKSRLHRAKRALRAILENEEPSDG
jgi:RNA polymerase sigma-70 factor (ECF subfamily)